MTVKEKILKEIKNTTNVKRLSFPKDIDLDIEEPKIIVMKLSDKVLNTNMQDNAVCFEGWAFVLHVYYKNKEYGIKLDFNEELKISLNKQIEEMTNNSSYCGNDKGHLNRFLYRALRFREQYEWFSLSNELQGHVNKFKKHLDENKFVNNLPTPEKESNDKNKDAYKITESFIENLFKDRNFDKKNWNKYVTDDNSFYRQLPVGLFEAEVKKEKSIFTGGKSAIDLWSVSARDKALNIFELKYDNKMIGIITEIFFYCNYVNDMYCKGMKTFEMQCNMNGQALRGYDKLCTTTFLKINGFMLCDENNMHPLIRERDLLDEMNSIHADQPKIRYGIIKYRVNNIKCDVTIL